MPALRTGTHPSAASAPAIPPSAGSSASGGSASAVSQITTNLDTFFNARQARCQPSLCLF
jgi:hypothetical protein